MGYCEGGDGMDLSIAVVTKDGTKTSIRALVSAGAVEDGLLINNGCCPGHLMEVRATVPLARFIDLCPSRGLAHCWNLAVLYAAHEHVVIANDDIELDEGWQPKVEAALQDHDHVNMAYPTNRWGCFATSKAVVRELGWFDERFVGIYYEDEDWWLRLQEAGKRVTSVDVARHDGALRAADRLAHGTVLDLDPAANEAAFLAKWQPWTGGEGTPLALKGAIGECNRVTRARPEDTWHAYEGLWNG